MNAPEISKFLTSRGKVLVVDDNPGDRYFHCDVLGRLGYQVLTAEDGAEALELVRQERPVLVLTDLQMPVMDGYALAQAIRADADIASTRIVFCTAAYCDLEARELADDLVAADVGRRASPGCH